MARRIRIFRYDPAAGGSGHFDSYTLEIPNETTTTILDVLLRVQQEQDPMLAFRFACRVNMCGSCGMVINGREALACKTNVSEIAEGEEITIRPLNHFPVIKDLVVDMEPFFRKYESVLPFYDPIPEADEPARIAPDSRERLAIGGATECIACGCCVSSCTMVRHHDDYAGPAALNRAFTLLADSRDGLFAARLDRALESCYSCRSEFNCTEVCPKGISPSRAIKGIQRAAVAQVGRQMRIKDPRSAVLGAAAVATLAVLAYFAGGWGVTAKFGVTVISAALVLAALSVNNARRHPLLMAVSVACAAGILFVGATERAGARPYGGVILVPDRPLTPSEQHGLQLYAGEQCAYCHQIRGEGGHRTGPDLSNIVAKGRTQEYLARYIRNPQAVSGATTMPRYNVPEADLRALADFVLALDFSHYAAKRVKREEVLRHE